MDIKPISKLSNQFWLLSSLINLIRNVYDWYRIYQHHAEKERVDIESSAHVPETLPTLLDTAKNAFDILIPMNGLQYAIVPGVVQGATGAVSSIIGIATVWDDHLKLTNR